MQECTFNNVGASRPLGSIGRAVFYSDNVTIAVGDNAGGVAASAAGPLALSRAAGLLPAPLTQWEDFFVDVQKVCL